MIRDSDYGIESDNDKYDDGDDEDDDDTDGDKLTLTASCPGV